MVKLFSYFFFWCPGKRSMNKSKLSNLDFWFLENWTWLSYAKFPSRLFFFSTSWSRLRFSVMELHGSICYFSWIAAALPTASSLLSLKSLPALKIKRSQHLHPEENETSTQECNARSKVLSNHTVPCWSVSFIKFLFSCYKCC